MLIFLKFNLTKILNKIKKIKVRKTALRSLESNIKTKIKTNKKKKIL